MIVVLISLLTIVGFAVGALLGKSAGKDEMSKSDRKELEELRSMREELIASAAEHATLGDDFAVIALGMMRRKELP
jgi:hypothetical protein